MDWLVIWICDPGTEITGKDRLNYEHVIFSWHESAHPQLLRILASLQKNYRSCLCSIDPVMPKWPRSLCLQPRSELLPDQWLLVPSWARSDWFSREDLQDKSPIFHGKPQVVSCRVSPQTNPVIKMYESWVRFYDRFARWLCLKMGLLTNWPVKHLLTFPMYILVVNTHNCWFYIPLYHNNNK